jgi:hypothetical protein
MEKTNPWQGLLLAIQTLEQVLPNNLSCRERKGSAFRCNFKDM